MPNYEYKVVPAPTRGVKAKGLKGTQARFAHALETVMNDLGAQGWDYQRTDTLPVEERQGLTGKTTTFQNMLVFRRALPDPSPTVDGTVGLIEDKSETLPPKPEPHILAASAIAPAVDGPEVPQAPDAPEAASDSTVKDISGSDTPVSDAASTTEPKSEPVEAETPSETEAQADKPPFAFPWNRKPASKDAQGDGKDTALPD